MSRAKEIERKCGIETGEELGMKLGMDEVIYNMIQHDFRNEMIIKVTAVMPRYIRKIRTLLDNEKKEAERYVVYPT
jgi:hypothetical protein